MKNRCALHCKRLKGVTHSVTYVKSLAYAMLKRVFKNDTFLNGNRFRHHLLQHLQVGLMYVVCHKLRPHLLVVDESVLEHLGITRTEILVVHSLEEYSVEDNVVGIVKYADFIF